MKRRDFIQTLAAGVGGLTGFGARGQEAAPAAKPLRVALIGCGDSGARQLLPECCKERVVALVDPDRSRIDVALGQIRKTPVRSKPSTTTASSSTRWARSSTRW